MIQYPIICSSIWIFVSIGNEYSTKKYCKRPQTSI